VKLRVDRDALGDAVAFVARALPTRPVVPVLSGLLVEADGDRLTLSCFDYEVSARVTVSADVGEPGTALVPGRLLAEICKSLPPAEVEIVMAAGMVMLTCGSAEFALVALPLEEYPALPELPAAAGTVDGGVLATAAAQVVPSASRDDTLPMLTGVCLDFDGQALTLAATDRYRLAVRTVTWEPSDPALRASALVPARTLADVARSMGPAGPVTIAFGQPGQDGTRPADGMISFEGGGRRLTARLIGTEFIRYQSRFPASFEATAELAAGPFLEAVRRVSLVADRASPVQMAFRRGVVVIEARSDGRARAVESVPVTFHGTEQMISFNPQYLLDGITAAALSGQAVSGHAPSGHALSGHALSGHALSGHALSGQGRPHPAGEADVVPAHGSGRIRLEFSSPAKPALISWIDRDATAGAGEDDPGPADSMQIAGNGAVTVAAGSGAPGAPGRADYRPADAAAFRYLVVPLRVPVVG
jgi:DNA polymerase-3 subunit beta